MKNLVYACKLSFLSCCFSLLVFLPSAKAQITYFALAGSALILITVDGGNCDVSLVGTISGPGTAQAIAICPSGQLYISDILGDIYLLDPFTMQTTFIANSPSGYITALTCSASGLLYAGTTTGELLTIDPNTGDITILGILPDSPNDLVFYNGSLYMSTAAGLVLVDINNPQASALLFGTSTSLLGLSVGPDCGTLMGSTFTSLWEVNLLTQSSNLFCSAIYGLLDLTSPDEFNPPSCEPMLDLDDDDSSGAPNADFNTGEYSCLTVGGLPIADADVVVIPPTKVVSMTIVLTGVLDAPDEVLILNNAPAGIAVSGSGTQAITLTNSGNASADVFEQALRLIRYFNYAKPFTPGLREVLVSFVNSEGLQSNEATAHLWVVELPETIVDLGPDLKICAWESVTLDAGNPGATYLWNNFATTQTIIASHAGEYSVTVTYAGSCPGTDKMLIEILPTKSITFQGSTAICKGKTAVLTISSNFSQPLDVLLTGSDGSQYPLTVTGFRAVPVMPTTTTTYSLEVPAPPADTCFQISNPVQTIVVYPVDTTYGLASICAGDSIFLAGAWQRDSGVYSTKLTNVYGCDSTRITTLSVIPPITVNINANTCNPAQAGVDTLVLQSASGCDSIVVITTMLLLSDTVGVSAFSCNPADTGVFYQNLTNAAGCDSLVITTIALLASDTVAVSAFSCNPADTGIFYQNLTNAAGCDSLVVTTVGLLASDTVAVSAFSCDPADTGVFYQNLTNAAGCDSLVVTTVGLLASDTVAVSAFSCDPADTGVFYQNLTNAAGCDSLVVTTVGLLASDTVGVSAFSCDPADTGVFYQNLTNAAGCDSLVVTTVGLLASDTVAVSAFTCDPADTGVFYQNLSNANGCDSTVITTVSLLASDTILLFGTSCNPANTGIFYQNLANVAGCDSTVITTITFSQADTTLLFTTTCDPVQAGLFTQNLTTPEGCDSLVITSVTLVPSDTVQLSQSTCDPAAAGIFTQVFSNQYGCDSTVVQTVALLPADTSFLFFETCNPVQVGLTTTVLVNQYGCDSLIVAATNLLPASSCVPNIWFSGSTLPCLMATGSLSLSISSGQAPFSFEIWQAGSLVASGMLIDTGQTVLTNNFPVGNYTVIVTDQNGYSATAAAAIVPAPMPQIEVETNSMFNGFEISCQGATDGSAQATGSGGMAPYTFLWSNAATGSQIDGLAAGSYTVTLTDAKGCTDTGFVVLLEPAKLEADLVINEPDCFDLKAGRLLAGATGGALPYVFSLNGGGFQSSGLFADLSSGSYTIAVMDANGCEAAAVILINAPLLVDVELGDDLVIDLGDGAGLKALVNIPFDSLVLVEWSPLDSVECPGCLDQIVYPVQTTAYTIKVVTSGGCSDQDTVRVIVNRRKNIYVPNVFSPNGDGENDIFTLYPKPGSVEKIRTFFVFSRWGELVYQYSNFLPDDPAIGWDGTHRGQPLDPAVFAWYAVIEFKDGEVVLFEGDVTLVK